MRRFLTRVIVVFCLTAAVGGHWGILQSIAWIKMTVDYSKEQSFTSAVEKVFSGEAPCELCLLVDKGKKEEQKNEMVKPNLKLDYLLTISEFNFFVPQIEPDNPSLIFLISQIDNSPPSPPPRDA